MAILALQGFFEVQAQFYLLFLTPLRIADKYRLTQELTPAGTIISLNLVVTCLACNYIRSIVLNFTIDASEPVQRIIPICMMVVAIIVSYKPAVIEL